MNSNISPRPHALSSPNGHWLFAPVRPLLGRMPISGKVSLLAGALFIPLAALLANIVVGQNQQIESTRSEQSGAVVAHKLLDLVLSTDVHRGAGVLGVNGDASALNEARTAIANCQDPGDSLGAS